MSRILCSICYDFISSESILLHLDCGHIYHDSCLSQWTKTSKTCPDCRKNITKRPSRVYPNFDVNDETLQLANNIKILENKNKLLEDQLTQVLMNQHARINAILDEKTIEVVSVTNTLKSLERMHTDSKLKNDELTRTNEELAERLGLCHGKYDSVCKLLISQQNESTILRSKTADLEKKLQFAESNAQMDKYFRTVANNEKDEVSEQLNDTQSRLSYAQYTIDRNFVQIETILGELDKMRKEKQLQTARIQKMEQMICERDIGRRGIEVENVQLKSKLKEITSRGTDCASAVEQKRKCKDFYNLKQVLRPSGIDSPQTGHPPLKLIIRKMKRASNFACVRVT